MLLCIVYLESDMYNIAELPYKAKAVLGTYIHTYVEIVLCLVCGSSLDAFHFRDR